MTCSRGSKRSITAGSWVGFLARRICAVARIALLTVVVAAPVNAQTPCSQNCTLKPGQTFSIAFDPPVEGPPSGPSSGYRLYIDNVKIGPDISPTAGTTTIPDQVLTTIGPHHIQVEAFNASGVGPKTPALTVTITQPPPGMPQNLRILVAVTVAENGSIGIKVVGIEPGVP